MAVSAPVLWGWTLAPLSEYEDPIEYRAGTQTMANGSLVVDVVNTAYKRNFTLTWRAITAAKKGDILTAYQGTALSNSASFTGPDNTTYTVTIADPASGLTSKAVQTAGGLRWDVVMKLREL